MTSIMKTIKDIRYGNLQIVVKELGSQQALADLLDKAHAQINQLVNKRRSVGNMIAREIEQKTGKPNGWMDTDHGLNNVTPVAIKETHKVPLISWVQAGEWCEAVDLFQPGDAEEWPYCPVPHSPSTYALTIHGVSMFNPSSPPSFSEGDTIFVDPQKEYRNKSLVIAKIANEQKVTFKQLIIEDNIKFLRPLNPEWPEKIIPLSEDSLICGVVIAKLEKFF